MMTTCRRKVAKRGGGPGNHDWRDSLTLGWSMAYSWEINSDGDLGKALRLGIWNQAVPTGWGGKRVGGMSQHVAGSPGTQGLVSNTCRCHVHINLLVNPQKTAHLRVSTLMLKGNSGSSFTQDIKGCYWDSRKVNGCQGLRHGGMNKQIREDF